MIISCSENFMSNGGCDGMKIDIRMNMGVKTKFKEGQRWRVRIEFKE